MANKSIKELRNLTNEELVSRARTTEEKLFHEKLKMTTGQLENTANLWKMRKEFARIKMILSEKNKKTGNVGAQKRV